VHIDDPAFNEYRDISEVPKHLLREMKRFFEDYKTLEAKAVSVEEFGGVESAITVVRKGLSDYRSAETRLRGWGY
jgi:inorganic pyrophosphatase